MFLIHEFPAPFPRLPDSELHPHPVPVGVFRATALNERPQCTFRRTEPLTDLRESFIILQRWNSSKGQCETTELIQQFLVLLVQDFPQRSRLAETKAGTDLCPINRPPTPRGQKILLVHRIAEHVENP